MSERLAKPAPSKAVPRCRTCASFRPAKSPTKPGKGWGVCKHLGSEVLGSAAFMECHSERGKESE